MSVAEEILGKFDDSQTLPHVAIRILQLINDEKSTLQSFEEVIKLDPILVTRLLRLVNSAYFGLAQKVDSISKAIVFVGMDNLRNLVAVETLKGLFREKDTDAVFSRKKVWIHSATVAILSEMIARRLLGHVGADYFLAGIVHDIGLIVEDQVVGDKLHKACASVNEPEKSFCEMEQEIIGTNHCELGGLIAKQIQLPSDVRQAIIHHHATEKKQAPSSISGVVQIADFIANNLNYAPFEGKAEVAPLPPSLASHVKHQSRYYKVIIAALPEQIANAKELYEIEG